MLGPLPFLHRAVLVTAVLLTAVASGAWVAHNTPLPVAGGVGALVGGLAGVLVAYFFVHDSHHQPVRVVSRRR
jgi:hypothetical protein